MLTSALLALAVGVPSTAAGQRVLQNPEIATAIDRAKLKHGTYIHVHTSTDGRFYYYLGYRADTLLAEDRAMNPAAISFAEVRSIYAGAHRPGRAAAIGALSGAVVGMSLAALSFRDCSADPCLSPGGGALIVGLPAGLVTGSFLGLVAGHFKTHWVTVYERPDR